MNTTSKPSHGAESSPLGKPADYCDTYSPDLLFPIPRQLKRDELGIEPDRLPFVGEDLWNGYELSWLNPRGKPVVALATFRVPADSPRLIESKSLKLYLNSCNQSRFENAEIVQATFERDLSEAAGAPVAVAIQPIGPAAVREIAAPPGESLDELDIDIDTYQPCPDFLACAEGAAEVSETLHSHLLKSNCLVTGQPDWGCIVIRYVGPAVDRAGLLRYIVSFRKHNEFHEQCVERVFCDILRRCRPRELAVWARYTRRGGLDINPFRSTGHFAPPGNLSEIRQ